MKEIFFQNNTEEPGNHFAFCSDVPSKCVIFLRTLFDEIAKHFETILLPMSSI